MESSSGSIFDIKKYAIHDGPGIRTTVFFQGCPLSCWWCHNPESQSPRTTLMVRANRCLACQTCVAICPQNGISMNGTSVTDRSLCDLCGECVAVCYSGAREISGKPMTVAEVMAEVQRDVPFYDQSGGGVTFSGGEPLLQRRFLAELLANCQAQEIHTVVDTSGYAPWDVLDSIRHDVDLFLYDLKVLDDQRHQQYTGVSNRLILDNLQRLAASGSTIFVRIPLIPGINDDVENMQGSAKLLASLPNISGVELMAYHDIAEAKYEALGMDYQLPDTSPPSEIALKKAARYFEVQGLSVLVTQ